MARPRVDKNLKIKINSIKKCFSLSNLQPLWAKDNLRKGSNE